MRNNEIMGQENTHLSHSYILRNYRPTDPKR